MTKDQKSYPRPVSLFALSLQFFTYLAAVFTDEVGDFRFIVLDGHI